MAGDPTAHPRREPDERPTCDELMRSALNGGAAALLISIGHRAGLFDAMADLPPADNERIAAEAGLCGVHVRHWLAAMAAAGVIEHDAGAGTYRLPPENAAWLARPSGAGNLAVEARWIAVLASVEDQVVESFGHGLGVPETAFSRFNEVAAESAARRLIPRLISEIVPLVPDLPRRLTAGIQLVDVRCGDGSALIELASVFRASRFVGFDRSAAMIALARDGAGRRGLRNVRFEVRDVRDGLENDAYDAAIAFNALAELARPAEALANFARSLRPGGTLLAAELRIPSCDDENTPHPLDTFLHAWACLRTIPVRMAAGEASSPIVGDSHRLLEMLQAATFETAQLERLASDPIHDYFIARVAP